MEQNDPPYFTLEHRVLAWNLLYDFAKSINKIDGFGLSPFLTTAFTYLLRFFNNKDILVKGKKEPEKDLFTLVVVSELVTSKQFIFIYKLDDFIRINFDIVEKYTQDQQRILGESTLFAGGDELRVQQFKSEILRAELYFLTYIGWNLLSCEDFPFVYFQQWGQIMRKESVKQSEKELDNFRKMRGRAIHFMISLMVVLNNPQIRPDVLAAASIQGALSYIPLSSYSTLPENENFWATLVKADVDTDSFISLSNSIPDALESLKPFMLNTESINN